MNQYQLTLLIKNSLEEKAREEILAAVTKNLGEITKTDLWGKKKLAYPIAKQEEAYFAHYEFQSDPKTIIGLDRQINLNENIIRHLIVRV